ncbi:hypothetical protein FNO01nite_06640 [Flavobacterium noncentrifugens]|uniref:DUF4239 domain-containing protein n=1 Tax=Flavobacterium noncentrifugens TaxID=1128970 RepID=A0A1G8SW78_9FLAO|nr:hypothetical protein [Flavobacterium noncentrifugens]GEP49992.1 hypothetical protein FNO01nite_06640 [Flavobacterium noncentrifugens]SDJ33532.1 hypothetical protein SAMN04487935_0724 [Flavobacterium noncentrifugens]
MKHSFLYDTDALIIVSALFVLMFAAIKTGYKISSGRSKPDSDHSGILSSLLGLLALLLAFTFGMSGSRYDSRKASLVQESNDIGTAILRANVYPDSIANFYKKDFNNYLNARIAYFESGRDEEKISASQKKTAAVSAILWKRTTDLAHQKDNLLPSNMMIPALNSMFDSATTVNAAYASSVPESIVYLLLIFSIVISFYIGYSSGFKKTLEPYFTFGFCFLTCVVIYITLDLDRPRRGIINLQNEIVLLRDLQTNFN